MPGKMALDMRMIDPNCEDHPDNKASHCAKMIADYYKRYDAHKGTQFVFSDLGDIPAWAMGGTCIRKSSAS